MTVRTDSVDHSLIAAALAVLVNEKKASIALLQLRLHLGYSAAYRLMEKLEEMGAVEYFHRQPGEVALTNKNEDEMGSNFLEQALTKFDGCDGGDAGSPEHPSTWVFGIEYANDGRIRDEVRPAGLSDDDYVVRSKLTYKYNENVFKLLASIEGADPSTYVQFAHEKKLCTTNAKGHFMGNLYPIPCSNLAKWTPEASAATGFKTKLEYETWCDEHRLPVISKWVEEYQPKLFIGAGTTYEHQFSKVFFGTTTLLEEFQFEVDGSGKIIKYKKDGERLLVVIPHQASVQYSLNSNESMRIAGKFIREKMAS